MLNYGRAYRQFCMFIDLIKSGKTCIWFAPDYVVIDRKSYDKLINPPTNKKPEEITLYDGWGEVDWEKLKNVQL